MNDIRKTDQRDLRHKRAREVGNEFARRARDAETLTTIDEERAVAERYNLAPRMPARSGMYDAVPGVAEPKVTVDVARVERLVAVIRETKPTPTRALRRPSLFARLRARFALWRIAR